MDFQLLVLLLACLITGFSKFSIGGMGLIILPVLMLAYSGPEALGIIVPLYLITDVMAVVAYRGSINWQVITRLMPISALGVTAGAFLITSIPVELFTPLLGGLVLVLLALGIYTEHNPMPVFRHPVATQVTGMLVGFVSMTANAAGSLVSLYLLEQNMEKRAYVGTRAWVFFMLNIMKMVALLVLGLSTSASFEASLYGLPALFVGMWLGHTFLKKLNMQQFKNIVRGAISVSAANLLFFR